MTDHDRAAARREITDALQKALDRRHEVLDVIVEADNKAAAVDAIAKLLGTSHAGGEQVMAMSFDLLTKDARKRIADELEDLNSQLSFAVKDRPASFGDDLILRQFSADADRDIFATRTSDVGAAGDGSGRAAGDLDEEIRAAVARVSAEEAVWLVAEDAGDKVAMVFGELLNGEVNVRIWVHPVFRHRGYGTAALRRSRSEMASYFPAVPMVVRAPGATPK
ncbi:MULTISPECIES: GNAT family N-acetyltransferase [Mycolicibacterium]|jgi:GNAT superfamily N-acetyltransferase|uniref:Acetyltransferase n=1 Tax=Mycolicibacterium mucogenicum TaxID=56689 RepID=A0A1A0LT27_MYCMU|nr:MULTISPECIES: GNAT family N-acetyltransferase [Mycolicibacterium]OBA76262.1 acetyltransferase [Mycolicibacterium mucogenicum]GCB01289.1 N-acetyltransferase [Mycolicibacterium sp. NCC-Tsukiji]